MTRLTVDVGGGHVLIKDPDGHTIRVPVGDLDQLTEQIARIGPTTPGARRRDRDGDVWTRRDDGLWEFPHHAGPEPWENLDKLFGPLYPVALPK